MGKVKTKLTGKVLCQGNDDFDWTPYEHGYCGGNSLVVNPSVKVKNSTLSTTIYLHLALMVK